MLGYGGALAVKVVRDGPEMLLGMEQIQLLASVGKAVLGQVPDPRAAVGDDQDQPGQTQATASASR